MINDVEILPRGLLFWRSLTSWLGGMGILLLMLTVLPSLGVVGLQIYKAELPGPTADKLVPRLADTVKILYLVYGGMTLLQTILLLFGGLSLYDSLLFAFATVSTGGFAPYNTSLARFSANSYVIIIMSVWMILSGVNFGLYYDLWRGRWRNAVQNSELRFYLALTGISIVVVMWNLWPRVSGSLFESFKHALVQVSSIITTTGYSSADYNQWPDFSRSVLFILMFTGACAGSTTGAIKLIRVIIAGKLIKREVAHLLHSRAMVPITVNGYVVPEETTRSVCAFFFVFRPVCSWDCGPFNGRDWHGWRGQSSCFSFGECGPGVRRGRAGTYLQPVFTLGNCIADCFDDPREAGAVHYDCHYFPEILETMIKYGI